MRIMVLFDLTVFFRSTELCSNMNVPSDSSIIRKMASSSEITWPSEVVYSALKISPSENRISPSASGNCASSSPRSASANAR